MSTRALEETAASAAAPAAVGWRRALDGRLALLVLTGVLFALAQLPDPAGYLSTDVGGKTATLEVMLRDGWRLPDLGYWAAEYDPDGSLYPLSNTRQQGDAWVNVTTLPMLLVALPLYALGGMRLAILLPVLGTVAAAAGARRLALELGGDERQQRFAFWLVGLASPATIYALDFWEHSLGLALLVWATVGILRASRPDGGGAWIPLAAGFAYGVAATMRQEALVYGFVAGAALGLAHLLRGRLLGALGRGGLLVAGVGTALVGNALLERLVLGAGRRASRNVGTAQKAGGDLGVRVGEAFESGLAPMWSDDLVSLVMALALAASLGFLAARADADPAGQRVLWLGVATVYGLLVADLVIDGMRFVPGLLATTPLAAFGAVRSWAASERRTVALLAVVPLPLVWAVQYLGGQSAQWGRSLHPDDRDPARRPGHPRLHERGGAADVPGRSGGRRRDHGHRCRLDHHADARLR